MNRRSLRQLLQTSPMLRAGLILLGCAAAVGGLGCATMIAATGTPNPLAGLRHSRKVVVLRDKVFAMAHPDAALSKELGHEGVVAFLGQKHTYLLVEGGGAIETIAHALGGSGLTLDPGTRGLCYEGEKIWGDITLTYKPEKSSRAPATPEELKTLGFKLSAPGQYTIDVRVAGVVASAAKLKKAVPDQFDTSREIVFYDPKPANFGPPPNILKLITIPAALVVDVALTPVYAMVILSISSSMH